MGRPKLYHTEEERKAAITRSKTKYMLNKIWHCDACNRDYSLAAKWSHIPTKKHQRNSLTLRATFIVTMNNTELSVSGRSLRYNVIRFIKTFYPSVFVVSGNKSQPNIIIPLTVKRYNGLAVELTGEKEGHKYLRKIGWKVILRKSYQTITKKITNYMNQVSNSCQLCRKYYRKPERLQKHMLSLDHYENIFMAD